MPKLNVLSASLVLALGLTACGGSSVTSTPVDPAPSASAGTLVDDLIIGATVFCDVNGNKTLDAGESSATTDDAGRYTFSQACTASILSVAGTGYDKTTLKAPKGQYQAKAGSLVVSPFTTMFALSGLTETEFKAVLVKMGLGEVDVANFDPTKDSARATTAAALAKILNDIAEITASLGGDPAAAFKGALTAMVTHLRANDGATFGSAASLGNLVEAALTAGLSAGNTGAQALTAGQMRNAVLMGRDGITAIASNVKNMSSLEAAADALSNDAVKNIIGETDLNDDAQCNAARTRMTDSNNIGKAQYVYIDDDTLQIVPVSGNAQSVSLTQFASGVTVTGQTLGTLAQLLLPVDATALALPKKGATVSLALQIENTTTGGMMQAAISKVVMARNSDGTVSAVVADNSKLDLYMQTASGIQIGTGDSPFDGVGSAILADNGSGLGIDMQKLAAGMLKRFPDNASLINKVLAEKGTYNIKLVATELDLRRANGTRLTTGTVSVKVPGSTKITKVVRGVAVSGAVTF